MKLHNPLTAEVANLAGILTGATVCLGSAGVAIDVAFMGQAGVPVDWSRALGWLVLALVAGVYAVSMFLSGPRHQRDDLLGSGAGRDQQPTSQGKKRRALRRALAICGYLHLTLGIVGIGCTAAIQHFGWRPGVTLTEAMTITSSLLLVWWATKVIQTHIELKAERARQVRLHQALELMGMRAKARAEETKP